MPKGVALIYSKLSCVLARHKSEVERNHTLISGKFNLAAKNCQLFLPAFYMVILNRVESNALIVRVIFSGIRFTNVKMWKHV